MCRTQFTACTYFGWASGTKVIQKLEVKVCVWRQMRYVCLQRFNYLYRSRKVFCKLHSLPEKLMQKVQSNYDHKQAITLL